MCMRTRHDYGSDDVSQEHREHLYKEMEGLYKEIVDFYRDRNVSNSVSPLPWLIRLFSTPRLRKNSG